MTTTYAEAPAAAAVPVASRPRRAPRWPLLVVLALQAVVSVSALRSTAFQDEALYLYAGRQIIHHWGGGPVPLDHYAFYFSGYPDVYPVIGGFLDMVGGLELARAFSLACMLAVTAIVYSVSRRLFGPVAAIFAAAAYAATGVVLVVGRLATFDALCLLLIAAAAAVAVYGGAAAGRRGLVVAAIGPLLVLAVLAKYAALLFIPAVLALLVCATITFRGWRAVLVRVPLVAVAMAASAAVAYRLMDKAALHAIHGSTTSRVIVLKAARPDLLTNVLQMGGVIFLLALVGLVLVAWHQRRLALLAAALFGSSWLAPAYHIYVQESISLDKHIAYALFFAMPLAGYALAWLSGYGRRLVSSYRGYWLAGLAIVLALFTLGLAQARNLYGGWANTSEISYTLHTQLRDGSGRILAEDIEVARFDAMDVTEPWQWNGLRFPYYLNARHQQFLGNQALAQAIKDRYYDWVELSFNYLPGPAWFAAAQMAATRNYDLIAVILFSNSYGKGHFYIWRLALQPGHGNFTSLAQLRTRNWG